MIARIRTLIFAILLFIGTVVAVVATLAAVQTRLAGPAGARRGARYWVRFHHFCARTLLGINSRVEGGWPAGPVLFAAKHQAMYEALELVRLLGEPAAVLKRELAQIPGFGRAARAYGVIPVDRAGSGAALRGMMRAAEAAKANGQSILIFPEGTRVAPGETPPLRPGFAGLYRLVGLPVIPIALDSGRLWPRTGPKHAGNITFRFGEPIPPGLPRQEIEARVHAAINALEAGVSRSSA